MPDRKEITTADLFGISGTLPRELMTPGDPAAAEAARVWFRRGIEPGAGEPIISLDQRQPQPDTSALTQKKKEGAV
jgi:hypothetical protein